MKKSNHLIFLGIFEDLFESMEGCSKKFLVKKYGEDKHTLFSTYYFGGIEKYVRTLEKKDGEIIHRLTTEGADYYLSLKRDYESKLISRINTEAVTASAFILAATFLLTNIKEAKTIDIYFISGVILFSICIFSVGWLLTHAIGNYIYFRKIR